jgi:hypothetical protein
VPEVPGAAVPNAAGVASDKVTPDPVLVADKTPEAIAKPDPTITAPAVLEVAAGSRAAGTVPALRSLADPLVAIVAKPVIVLAAWLWAAGVNVVGTPVSAE